MAFEGEPVDEEVLRKIHAQDTPPPPPTQTEQRLFDESGGFLERRRLLPVYADALKAGAFSGGTDSANIISEDRSSCEDAPG
jgi:hypothetical protein